MTDGAKQDPYSVLGVSRDAEEGEIRKACRQLARLDHPDVNPGDLYVVVQICVPRDLSPGMAEKLEELAELEPAELRKELFR